MFDWVLNMSLYAILSDIRDLVFFLLAICGVYFPDDKEAASLNSNFGKQPVVLFHFLMGITCVLILKSIY